MKYRIKGTDFTFDLDYVHPACTTGYIPTSAVSLAFPNDWVEPVPLTAPEGCTVLKDSNGDVWCITETGLWWRPDDRYANDTMFLPELGRLYGPLTFLVPYEGDLD